jgi:antitoxin component of RelBE/YafQ-DinJ toxin-antitoxin module
MTKAVTLRLDDDDHRALARQAEQLGLSPGTLARILVRAALGESMPAQRDARTAIARLVRRSRQQSAGDAVTLVNDARAALGADR